MFARKSNNIEESKAHKSRPEDYQIGIPEESILSGEELTIDHRAEPENSSPDTLITQIGIEETNIKTIGVSGTKPKAHSGSLTDR